MRTVEFDHKLVLLCFFYHQQLHMLSKSVGNVSVGSGLGHYFALDIVMT